MPDERKSSLLCLKRRHVSINLRYTEERPCVMADWRI